MRERLGKNQYYLQNTSITFFYGKYPIKTIYFKNQHNVDNNLIIHYFTIGLTCKNVHDRK